MGGITSKAFKNNTDLLFSSELAAGETLDILDELPGLFSSGFSLPGLVCDLLYHGLLLPLNDNLLLYRNWSKPQSVY